MCRELADLEAIGKTNGWFYKDLDGVRPPQALQRLWKISQAAHSAVASIQTTVGALACDIVPWGEKLLGTEKYQVDE